MALKIILSVIFLIVAVLVYAATRSNTFQLQRSTTIKAPPETVFALINDFHSWKDWAPQDMEDSSIERTFSGPKNGVGAISEWDSTGSAGRGQMMIMNSVKPTKVSIAVDWAEPFKVRNYNEFNLEPAGKLTVVTWTMRGPNVFIMKLMSVFVNMDKMMGKHFEQGLSNLKRLAERT